MLNLDNLCRLTSFRTFRSSCSCGSCFQTLSPQLEWVQQLFVLYSLCHNEGHATRRAQRATGSRPRSVCPGTKGTAAPVSPASKPNWATGQLAAALLVASCSADPSCSPSMGRQKHSHCWLKATKVCSDEKLMR